MFKSFVPYITSNQITNYISSNCYTDITLEPDLNEPPELKPSFRFRYKIIPITLYSIKIWMGSTEAGYPLASQLQFILRVRIMDRHLDYSMFMELVSNIDERYITFCKFNYLEPILEINRNGYRAYAKDPLIFLKMVQASDEEKEALREMMRVEGISIPPVSSSCNRILNGQEEEKFRFTQRYFNHHYYFRYMMFKNMNWKSTRELEVYERWLKCEEWLEHGCQRRIQHEPYCLYENIIRQNIIYIEQQIKYFYTKFQNDHDYNIIQKSGNYTFRIFSDGDEHCDNICCIDLRSIDRVYHVIRSKTYWELIARMEVKEYGSFYFEMIITDIKFKYSDWKSKNECIIFITRNPQLFMDIIQTGEKDKICSFIQRDEHNNKKNSLLAQCIRVIVNSFLDTTGTEGWNIATLSKELDTTLQIPHSIKQQVIDEGQQSLMIRSWKRAVEHLRYMLMEKVDYEKLQVKNHEKQQEIDDLINEKKLQKPHVTKTQLKADGWKTKNIILLSQLYGSMINWTGCFSGGGSSSDSEYDDSSE